MSVDSPLAAWLNLNPSDARTPLPSLQPCIKDGQQINCSDICYYPLSWKEENALTSALWDPATLPNLINCAMFWMVSLSMARETPPNPPYNAIAVFKPLGLELPTPPFSPLAMPSIGCFDTLWTTEFAPDAQGNAMNPDFACTPDVMFGPFAGNPNKCFEQLCSPKGVLNPDLGGIGVCFPRSNYGVARAD